MASCFSPFGMRKHASCPGLRRCPSRGGTLVTYFLRPHSSFYLGCNVLCLYKPSSAQVPTLLQRCTSLFSFFKILSQLESRPSLLCVYTKSHCPIFFICLGISNATGNFFRAGTVPHSCPAFCYCSSYRRKFSVSFNLIPSCCILSLGMFTLFSEKTGRNSLCTSTSPSSTCPSVTETLPALPLFLLNEALPSGLPSKAPFLFHITQLSFPVFKCRVQMGPAVKSEPGRPVGQVPTSFITWSPGGGRGWGGLGSSVVFQKDWHVRTQLFFGHPSLLSPAGPVIAGLARKLAVAAQGTAAASVCTNGKENAHGGLWATQATGSLKNNTGGSEDGN